MSSTKPTLMKFSLTLATLALVMAFLAAMAPATTANANDKPVGVGALSTLQGHFTKESQAAETYIVVLREAPLAMYDGGLPGLAPTSLKATGETKFNAQSAASQAYLDYLAQRRQSAIQSANQLLGRPLNISYEYGATVVGFATVLTPLEAQMLGELATVASVEKETISYPMTDAGPSWIGAPEVWGGPWEAIQYRAQVSGANEVPPVTTDATATAEFTYNYFTNELHYQIHVDNPDAVSFTAMHIHNGAVGVNGPVVYNFGLTATSATSFSVEGSTTLSDVNEGLLANGLLYVNAHSTTNAGGEIRGQIELVGSLGEGVLVGIIDTGIDPWNPSFAEVGGDGYIHTNPLGTGEYLGVCDPDNAGGGGVVAYDPGFPCNDKLIGVWGYTASDSTPRDRNGHGSHTASTTAGNFVESATITATIVVTANVSGVAPHANIIAYDGCIDGGGCPGASLTAARDQALLDGVDVINYSIGSTAPSSNVWGGAEALQWLSLRSAGVFVATSNGNAGPNSSTTGSPADLPWVMSVGASSHNRKFLNELIVTDSNGNSISIEGEAIAGGFGPAPIVFAENYTSTLVSGATANNARLCGFGAAGSNTSPWTPGTFTGDEIVICERGTYGRVEKGINAAAAGAGAMILAQPDEFGGGPGALASDPHVLPATHIDYYEYQALLDFIDAAPGGIVTGTLQGAYLAQNDSYGDIMASFSSRGPNRSNPDLIVPSITAPGRAIWAAYAQGSGGDGDYTYNVIQGTSMSSPHAAGTAALMVALHPDWSPAQVQSALMSTSLVDIYNDDGLNPATPFAMGAGRVQINEAVQAGFVLDITQADYVAANPATGGQPQQLNNASLGDADCVGVCVWVREIESTLDVATTWVITPELPAGMTMDVEPSSFTLPAGGTQVITFTADATQVEQEVWQFGRVWFTETTPTAYPIVELSKDDGGITATAGTSITYMLHYTNTGDGDAMGVWITETVPANTTFNASASSAGWTEVSAGIYTYYIGYLASGETGMVHFVVDVDSDTPNGSTIDNTAYITGEEMTVGHSSDSTPVTSSSGGTAVLEFSKSDGGITTTAGMSITYMLYYTNTGDADAIGVWITETVPANTTFNASASTAGWTEVVTGTYTLTVGDLAPDETGMAHFVVNVDSELPTSTTAIHNTAYIVAEGLTAVQASDSTPVEQEGGPTGYFLYLPNIAMNAPATATDRALTVMSGGDMPAVGTSTMGIAPVAHFPVALASTLCSAANLITIETSENNDEGDYLICGETAPASDLQIELSGLTEGDIYTDSLSVDPTNNNPYDNMNDGTVSFITVSVNDAARLVAQVYESEAPDLDLFVGTGNTPSAATQVCASTGGSFTEYCNINNPADGTWWVLIQNWAGSANQPDLLEYTVAVVPNNDVENWTVSAPSVIAAGDPLTATIAWDEPGFDPGSRWFGHATFGTDAGHPDNLAEVNVNFVVVGVPIIDTETTEINNTQTTGEVDVISMDLNNVGTADLDWNITEDAEETLQHLQGGVLYENGPFITHPGTGAGGADESAITAGLGSFGFAHSVAGNFRVADQFTVTDADGWTVTEFTFYGYQTGSTTTSTFTGVNYNIWDGPPNAGGTIIYSSAANALTNSVWTNVYRVSVTGGTETGRPIMANTAAGGVFLPQGTYWVDWQSAGSLGSGPWANPIAIVGQTTTGDALQSNAGVWAPLVDTALPQGLPFAVSGFVGGVSPMCDIPSDQTWLSVSPTSGTIVPGGSTQVDVTLDATGLAAGDYTATLCINSNDPVTSLVMVPVTMTVEEAGGPAISLDATVGTDSSTCATTDDITVASGTTVYYCYDVTNTGTVTLTLHDLEDSEWGTLLNDFPYTLAPGASAFYTASAVITETTVSTGTWTAFNPGPTDTATAMDTATVTTSDTLTVTYCRNGANVAIPDNVPAGVDDSQTVTQSGTIVDVNFFVNATHTYNGDVAFRLTHNATTLAMVDRPGYTGTGFGCSGNNFPNMTLDDEATTPGTPVETSCTSGANPAVGYPANSSYTPNDALTGFDGGDLNGVWTLNASDSAGGDTGTVVDWCVVIEYEPAP